MIRRPPRAPLFPYPTLFRSVLVFAWGLPQVKAALNNISAPKFPVAGLDKAVVRVPPVVETSARSEEHTSELQSRQYLVCRLLLEKKKQHSSIHEPLNPQHHT